MPSTSQREQYVALYNESERRRCIGLCPRCDESENPEIKGQKRLLCYNCGICFLYHHTMNFCELMDNLEFKVLKEQTRPSLKVEKVHRLHVLALESDLFLQVFTDAGEQVLYEVPDPDDLQRQLQTALHCAELNQADREERKAE